MEVIVGSSRCRRIVEILADGSKDKEAHLFTRGEISSISGMFIPGGKFAKVTEAAVDIVNKLRPHRELWPVVVYMVCGMTDSTTRIVDFYDRVKYEEVICTEAPTTTAHRVIQEIEASAQDLVRAGAIPVFATTAPMSFSDWNHWCLNEGKRTSHLLHFKQYAEMQELHNAAIANINSHIVARNSYNGVATPHLGSQILSKRGQGLSYRFRHNRLRDGCHPDIPTTHKWVEEMISVININRLALGPTITVNW